jgi:hypothetical protein
MTPIPGKLMSMHGNRRSRSKSSHYYSFVSRVHKDEARDGEKRTYVMGSFIEYELDALTFRYGHIFASRMRYSQKS